MGPVVEVDAAVLVIVGDEEVTSINVNFLQLSRVGEETERQGTEMGESSTRTRIRWRPRTKMFGQTVEEETMCRGKGRNERLDTGTRGI
jgi:hypothetical protein